MNEVYELKYVSDGAQKYLSFSLEEKSDYNKNIMQTITNNDIDGLLNASRVSNDTDNLRLRYTVANEIPLYDFLSQKRVNREAFFKILMELCKIISLIPNTYMIPENYILLDTRYIFITQRHYDIKMVCLPIKPDRNGMDLCGFIKKLLFTACEYDENDISSQDFFSVFNTVSKPDIFVLKDFMQLIDDLYAQGKHTNEEQQPAEKLCRVEEESRGIDVTGWVSNITPKAKPEATPIPPAYEKNDSEQSISGKESGGFWKLRKAKKQKEKENKKVKRKEEKKAKDVSYLIPGMTSNEPDTTEEKTPFEPVISVSRDTLITPEDKNSEPVLETWTPLRPIAVEKRGGTVILDQGSSRGFGGTEYFEPYIEDVATGAKTVINKSEFKIGRANDNDLVIDHSTVSSHHAKIICEDDKYYLIDTKSSNGVWVNNRTITPMEKVLITRGTRIKLANCEFYFYD